MVEYVVVIEGFYVLHFRGKVEYPKASKYGDGSHYVGISRDIYRRLDQHRDGEGSMMTRAAFEQGVSMATGRIYLCPFSQKLESEITKRAKSFCKWCFPDQEERQIALIEAMIKRSHAIPGR